MCFSNQAAQFDASQTSSIATSKKKYSEEKKLQVIYNNCKNCTQEKHFNADI